MEGKAPNPALPYREDCWSEGATSALIDAWGERYVELNRGNLRQKQWQEVADAVNSRRTAVRRPLRSDIQCKNRIDTLKKKYKAEKARIANSGGVLASHWPFFDRLDSLIVAPPPPEKKPSPPPPPPPLPLPYKKHLSLAGAAPVAAPCSREKRLSEEPSLLNRKYSAAAAAAAAAAAERKDVELEAESSKSSAERPPGRGRSGGDAEDDDDDAEAVRELARAISHFGEVYERVEREKQRQMMDLEKERMEFTKGLEFQRMQIFVDCQLQLEKAKRVKRDSSDNYL
ncbi:trihelix transcription factor ENAP2-like [Wolffia australiana]